VGLVSKRLVTSELMLGCFLFFATFPGELSKDWMSNNILLFKTIDTYPSVGEIHKLLVEVSVVRHSLVNKPSIGTHMVRTLKENNWLVEIEPPRNCDAINIPETSFCRTIWNDG